MQRRHVLIVCAAAAAAMLLFPPWVWTDGASTRSAGYAPVWNPMSTTDGWSYRSGVMSPDYPRLGLQLLAVVVVGGLGWLTTRSGSGSSRPGRPEVAEAPSAPESLPTAHRTGLRHRPSPAPPGPRLADNP